MDVDFIATHAVHFSETSKAAIDRARGISKLIIGTLQRISFSISPAMLDDFGLNAAMEWLRNEISILNGIPCVFKSDYDEQSLSFEIRTDIFRICLETLPNVMEHANATKAKIRVEFIEENVLLTIADNDKDIDVDQKKETPLCNSMQERSDTINGQLKIKSHLGEGTTVRFIIAKLKNEIL